jgi:hypothetical protein
MARLRDGNASRRRQASAKAQAPLALPLRFGLRHHEPPWARSGGRRRQDQPTHGHPGAPRPAGGKGWIEGRDRRHRHHRPSSGNRRGARRHHPRRRPHPPTHRAAIASPFATAGLKSLASPAHRHQPPARRHRQSKHQTAKKGRMGQRTSRSPARPPPDSEPWLGPKDQASPLGASARPRLRKSASGFAARPRNAL